MQTTVAVAAGIVLFIGLIIVVLISLYVRHENNKDYSQMELRAPLVEFKKLNREEEANKAADEGHTVCASCAFDNFKSSAFCAACGEALTEEAKKSVAKGKVVANTLPGRRARVAKRNEWVRKVDVEGKVFWYRKGSQTSTASSGFAVTFAQEHEITIDVNASKTETLTQEVKNAKLSLVEASAADATVFALGGKLESTSHEKEVVEQAVSLDFPSKYASFVAKAAAALAPTKKQLLSLKVDRVQLFKQALDHISLVDAKFVRAEIQLKFLQKQAGPAVIEGRSWFTQVSELVGAPASGLFTQVDKANQAFFLNRHSQQILGDDHLTYFFAAGRLLGKGLLEGKLWSFHLAMPLLKIILGQPVTVSDLESFDNASEFKSVDALVEPVSEQLYAFLKGVYEVVPQELLMVLDAEELEYILCGSDVIDVDEWERTSHYNETIHAHPSKKWFWQFARAMSLDYKKRLLHFTTGNTRVPIGGFAALTNYNGHVAPFTIIGKELVISRVVRAQPCFNQMELPTYVHKRELKANLFDEVLDKYDFSQ